MSRNALLGLIAAVILALLVGGLIVLTPEPEQAPVTQAAPAATATSTPAVPVIADPHAWSPEQKALLATLSLKQLPPLPADPSNAVADNPAAAKLGHRVFFDMRFSSNGQVACATCHKPELGFTDGLPRARGVGVTPRKAMTLVGTAYSKWFFWDGRKDSMWSQALGPTESPVEHGGNRSQYAHLLFDDPDYHKDYEAVFGAFPDISDLKRFPAAASPATAPAEVEAWNGMTAEDQDTINRIFSNMGKAIAAYERLLMPGPGRLDAYIDAVLADNRAEMEKQLNQSEAYGLQLFTGRAQCVNCHNGPLLTNNAFHNTGIPPATDLPPDLGRREGVVTVQEDPFNCVGKYSDAKEGECAHLKYARTEGLELISAFKVPTLRNVALMAPYMHSGQIATLTDAIKHYSAAPLAVRGHSEAAQLNLSAEEMQHLEDFLNALTSPLAVAPEYLSPPPGMPQPVSTSQSKP